MVAMKRQAGSPMKASKKAKVVDDVGPKIKDIDHILSNADCDVPGPPGNRDMLISALPHALSVAIDERHAYQTTIANMIGEVTSGWVAKWEQKVTEATSHVESTETDKTAAAATQESATASLAGQKEDVKACKEALKAATDADKDAAKALKAAEDEVKDFDKQLKEIIARKENVEKVYNQHFLIMKNAESVVAADSKTHLKEVSGTMKEISNEPSLQLALAPALKKTPAERGSFDIMAIDGVEAAFTSTIKTLTEEISSADTTKAGKEAAATAAKAAHDATTAKKLECKTALEASEAAQAEKEKALEDAGKAVEATEKAASKALREKDRQQHGLDRAKGTLAAYQFLLERPTPPPPPEEPEAKKASYYKVIDGVRYDKKLLESCEAATVSGGRVSEAEAKALWKEAEDGHGVTDTEKATLEYAMKTYKFTERAENYLKECLRAPAE